MIGAICLIAVGAFGALYFTHKTFRDRVHDLCGHVKNLFVTKEEPASPAASSPTVTTAVTPSSPAGATVSPTVTVTQ